MRREACLRELMRIVTKIGIFAVAMAVSGCAEKEEAVPFDPTTQNLLLKGAFTGFDFDITEADVNEGEREYSPSRLCEVSAEFSAVVDGGTWGIDLEFSNFEPDSFGVGQYAIIGGDAAPEAGQTSFELRMDGDAALYERSAIGGSIDIRVYESDGTQAGRPDVVEAGSIGAVFEIDFGAGEMVEGSFNVDFSSSTVEEEEC